MKTLVNIGKLEEVKIQDEPAAGEKMNVKLSHGKCCKISAVFLTVLFAVVMSTCAALYVIKHNSNQTKKYELTVHYDNGFQKTENVLITDKEEMFETDDVYMIYDFSTGLVVMSYKNNADFQECYVNSFNMTEVPSPDTLRNKYTDSKVDIPAGDEVMEEDFEVTDIWMNSTGLGPRSQDVCHGKDVYFIRQLSDMDIRVRRQKKKEAEVEFSVLWGLFKFKRKVKKE